jgi:NADH:ubiquinone oxidoreductase subunit 6 (subunit J)
MTVQLLLFLILALVAITSALGMLISRNAIYSALFLVVNFATVAAFFLLLDAPFIAVAQVSVYTGAIMVLFLFVIMLLGAERAGPIQAIQWQRPLANYFGSHPAAWGYIIFMNRSLGTIAEGQIAGIRQPDPGWHRLVYQLSVAIRNHVGLVAGSHDRCNRADQG